MTLHYNTGSASDVFLGQKARSGPRLGTKIIDYGTKAANVIGGIMEGPTGWAGAAETFGGLVKDKMEGRL